MNNDSVPVASSGRTALLLESGWYVVAFALIVAIGTLNIPMPFVSDQAMSFIGAQTLSRGGTLYIDFWDNKLPGLIWFHQAAGEWFGYSEVSVHALELAWLSLLAIVLAWTLRSYYALRWLSAAAAVAVVGVYYARAGTFQLTQLEILVALPTYLALWFAVTWPEQRWRLAMNFMLSGAFAAMTVTFKIVFAPLFPALWLIASIYLYRSHRLGLAAIVRFIWLPASFGTAFILGLVATKFWLDGALEELLWTTFVYPGAALRMSVGAPYLRLLDSIVYFGASFAVWSVFIGFAAVYWWRHARDPLTAMLFAWLIIGLALILIQRFSWWAYHFLFLYAPAGILGVRGIDVSVRTIFGATTVQPRTELKLAMLLTFLALGAIASPVGQKINFYGETVFKKHGGVREIQEAQSPDYFLIKQSTRFLRDKEARKGDIYVFGDPLYYKIAGRNSALPIIGWAWDYFLDSQWQELPKQLHAARPPYIYVDVRSAKIIELRDAGVRDFLNEHYTLLFRDYQGTWFGAKLGSWDN